MEKSVDVWGAGTVRCLRVLWMLTELGVEYTHHPVGPRTGETQTDWFLALNPKHKVPVLRHGDHVLSESAAILNYLAEAFTLPDDFEQLDDPVARSTLNEWCFFIMTELDAHPLYIIRRHTDLSAIYGEAPVAVESAEEYFLDQIGALLKKFPRENRYLLGERMSTADILLSTCISWAAGCDIPLPDRLLGYQELLTARPAYREASRVCFPA